MKHNSRNLPVRFLRWVCFYYCSSTFSPFPLSEPNGQPSFTYPILLDQQGWGGKEKKEPLLSVLRWMRAVEPASVEIGVTVRAAEGDITKDSSDPADPEKIAFNRVGRGWKQKTQLHTFWRQKPHTRIKTQIYLPASSSGSQGHFSVSQLI